MLIKNANELNAEEVSSDEEDKQEDGTASESETRNQGFADWIEDNSGHR